VLDGHLVGFATVLIAATTTCLLGFGACFRMDFPVINHEVLIVGAGGAGLRAAIEASAAGVRVGLVCKSLLGKAHTVMAEGGIAAALANVDDRDSWRVHFADTMRGGQYVNNSRMAELHAKEAPARVRELEAWGAVFDRTGDGRILQRNFGGHRYPRLAHVGDRTGLEMIRTLQDHGVHRGIDVHMECTVITLLTDDGRVSGAVAYDRDRGRFKVFRANAVVLATGGIGRAYRISSNSWEYTADGHALAYEAGAELMDMEFVQFHPTGMVWPPGVQGILVTEGVRGEGGILVNKEGRRFMFDDIPDAYKSSTADNEEEGWRYTQGDKSARRPPELLTRDHVARCIVREIKEGRGSPHGGVFLDIAWIKKRISNAPEHIKRKLPSMYHQFKELADIDITSQAMEVGPTTHYVMGGVKVDGDTQSSTLPGLYAAGECAAGLHGANRLGGNSLSDLLVFGQRAGQYAAEFARSHGAPSFDEYQVETATRRALAPFERGSAGENPFAVQHDLQETMQDLVGIVRQESEMREALTRLAALRERAERAGACGNREYNTGWHTALDLANMLPVSEAVTRSAIERRESRGAHFREDYPDKDAAFGRFNIIVRRTAAGEMEVVRAPLKELPAELKQVIEENK
jgi:succinate dehydrogenase / fumarate reductase flavoprotein subunit